MSDEEQDRMPAGVLRKRKGWQGEELELERTMQRVGNEKDVATAVDLKQFQNHTVGIGYQAKHVVRQREAPAKAEKVVDMATVSKKRKTSKSKETKDDRLNKYLRCSGVREFRRQIEEILKSS